MAQYSDNRTPQADVLDEILWGRLSNFWTEFYDQSDRQALNAMYEAFLKVQDAESVRLYQIAAASSIDTCPIYTQRRWARLDLNRYSTLKAWFKFLVGGLGANASDDCVNPSNHGRHWHFNAPWVFSSNSLISLDVRRTIHIGYPISAGLTSIYTNGLRLTPGIGYTISSDGKSIHLTDGSPGQVFQLDVAVDLSASYYDGSEPTVVTPIGTSDGDLLLPDGVGLGQPVIVMIQRLPPPFTVDTATGAALCTTSNNVHFTSDRTLVLGSTYITSNRIRLPSGYATGPSDLVQVFAMKTGDFTLQHQHQLMTIHAPGPLAISGVSIDGYAAGLPVFGLVGGLGTVLHISVNGLLLAPDTYRVDLIGRTLQFDPALPANPDPTRVDISYTAETNASAAATGGRHLHHLCVAHSVSAVSTPDTFDDGGIYDDGGAFDTSTSFNNYTLPSAVDVTTLTTYMNGRLLENGSDYSVNVAGGSVPQTLFTFNLDISGADLMFDYRTATSATVFGGSDLASGQYAITQSTLDNLAGNYVNVTQAFKQAYGASDADLQWLVEAAYVAAAGGNPMLTLFFDEFPEYSNLPIDSAGQLLTAAQTRNIESADIQLIDIPFLVDRVVDPTVRLQSGLDYSVLDGAIYGSPAMVAARSANDPAPGVWWCPVVVLDEKMLAKNFGALVGDVRDSSPAYASALRANLLLRYQGAALGAVHAATCAYLGSPIFNDDGVVQAYVHQQTGWSVSLVNSATGSSAAFAFSIADQHPAVGDAFFAGQSLRGSPVFASNRLSIAAWDGSTLIVRDFIPDAQAGDLCHLQLTDPSTGSLSWVLFHIAKIQSGEDLGGPLFELVFRERSSLQAVAPVACHIVRDFGPPYATFDGTVQSVLPQTKKLLQLQDGSTYEVPETAPEAFGPGDRVQRGMPLLPYLASVFDDVARPNWHWTTPAQYQAALSQRYNVYTPATYTASATVTYRGDAYALMALQPAGTQASPGDNIVFTAASGAVAKLQVVGPTTTYGTWYVYDTAVSESTATVIGTVVGTAPAGAEDSIEQGTGVSSWSSPTAVLQSPSLFGGASLMTNGTGFPAAGRVSIVTPAGVTFECSYAQNASGILQDLTWVDPVSVVPLPPALPTGSVVYLTAKLRSKILHPAFLTLAQQRCSGITVNDTNADGVYGLLKASAAVVETSHVNWPTALADLLSDTAPAKASVVLFARHVLADSIPLVASDAAFSFEPPALAAAISTPTSTFSGGIYHIPAMYNAATVAAVVTGGTSLGTVAYSWTINTVIGTGSPGFVDANGQSAAITGLVPNERYSITVTMTTGLGPTFTSTVLLATDG